VHSSLTAEEFTYAGTEEGPFLARVKPVAFGQVRSKGSTQIIQSEKGVVDNIAEFTLFGKPGKRVLASLCVTEFRTLRGRHTEVRQVRCFLF
jgi:hypothetical protein